jgi:hypothetical protein
LEFIWSSRALAIFVMNFFFLSVLYGLAQNLVFVHLGENIPKCIFTTIKQARYFNENCDLYLLTDVKAYHIFKKNHFDFLERERVFLVNANEIPASKEHDAFHQVNPMDPSQFLGFWFYATERFFVLYDFICEKHLENTIHLENDSMLYIGLDELVPHLNALRIRMAAPFQSLAGCIPCLVFIRDQEILCDLIHHILHEMSSFQGKMSHLFVNDMQTLASFYRTYGAAFMMPLPTLMPEYAAYFPKRWSQFIPDHWTHLSFLSANASLFPGCIFDAAGLAIYMNGNDRKDSPGHGPGTIHSRSLFNPSFFSYFWGKDNHGRAVPYLSFRGRHFRILNLHFHSKMPEEYASFLDFQKELP